MEGRRSAEVSKAAGFSPKNRGGSASHTKANYVRFEFSSCLWRRSISYPRYQTPSTIYTHRRAARTTATPGKRFAARDAAEMKNELASFRQQVHRKIVSLHYTRGTGKKNSRQQSSIWHLLHYTSDPEIAENCSSKHELRIAEETLT